MWSSKNGGDSLETIERRRRFIINLIYYVSVMGLFYLFIKYAFWPFFPLIFAFVLSIAIQKPVDEITNKFHFKKGIVSVFMVLLVIGIIGMLIGLLSSKIVNEFRDFIDYLTIRIKDISWIERTAHSAVGILPNFAQKSISGAVDGFLVELRSMMQEGVLSTGQSAPLKIGSFNLSSIIFPSITGVWNTAKQIPSILIAVIVTIISCCFMTADYERITKGIKNLLPEDKRYIFSRTKAILFSSLSKLAKAYAVIMLITFSEMLLGLSIMRIAGVYNSSYIFVIAFITAILDILPIFGTGTVLIPWAIYQLIMGNTGFGVGLILLYALITIVRQIVEPKLVATQLDLPPVTTICAMYIGLQIFGVIGMFLMPITLFCVKLLGDEGIINMPGSQNPSKNKSDNAKKQISHKGNKSKQDVEKNKV
ncbi:MAG: sporulation integral membrane protein YtvI [Clostridia bacterium]|nr:sporulation integral membrane protein YtvI [Clostridia bacterium]